MSPVMPSPGIPGAPALELGPLPSHARMRTVDERVVRAPAIRLFDLVRDVERWPELLPHYRYVRFREQRSDGGGLVEMSAYRPFGPIRWPTRWLSEMQVIDGRRAGTTDSSPTIRFRHIGGVTRGMEVEWSFTPEESVSAPSQAARATRARIVHLWDGPRWPLIGTFAAIHVIGPVFVHGIASRTLAGLGAAAEAASSGEASMAEEVMSKGRTIGGRA